LATVTFAIRTLGLLGVRTLILTNAAGGVNTGFSQGALMVIDDHINLMGQNPLVGAHDDRFGERFPDMTEVYSPRLRAIADRAGKAIDLLLPHGIYVALLGPSSETPAEIRYLRTMGAVARTARARCRAGGRLPQAVYALRRAPYALGVLAVGFVSRLGAAASLLLGTVLPRRRSGRPLLWRCRGPGADNEAVWARAAR